MSGGPFGESLGTVSRRELLGSLARWSVPTVLTIALAARSAAAASCPPCEKKVSGKCRACTMNQILNCQCEPCLGAPYCSGGVRAPVAQPQTLRTSPGTSLAPSNPLLDLNQNPFSSPFQASPFNRSRYYSPGNPFGIPRDSVSRGGLFERLRPDQRRPF